MYSASFKGNNNSLLINPPMKTEESKLCLYCKNLRATTKEG